MKNKDELKRFRSISEIHEAFGMGKPQHPLISLSHFNEANPFKPEMAVGYDILSFYKITFITKSKGRLKYGQNYYDFEEGSLLFLAPNQLVGNSVFSNPASSYILLIHPDFLLGYNLANKIKQYGFFSYDVNEALHLSDTEKKDILSVFRIMESEVKSRIDEFSQDVIIAQIELLLSYANRFYTRQFITRKAVNNDILQRIETILDCHFNSEKSLEAGLPTVQMLSEQLNISPGYLSDLLRSLIGQNTQQYIHQKLIEKAKEKLSTTKLTVNEIAYSLGFEYPQSFSKLFKNKTKQSPLAFRAMFS
ncbi:AraC family transcriptional regulator [Sphingobacterium kitahiroshimense]|uniref:helix-turn-helix domain-containing protein n=1 Tax=Sphingobacterium sp. B16(2022) TaxID=2914044 RepID=UPI0014390FD1|nr:AraC family transcriptional regulator [Sphingobacterium sp. B16(2022)]NJI71988.1 AraC family transcriptional regulator [Sphingobacterium sp. B16(2022)]